MQDYRITATQLRRKFFDFFGERCHVRIAQSSLVPENDPTALFISAGMQPLVPYLLGEKHAAGKRLMNVQRCFRTSDIELVGDSSHLTFLEMLGCWSLGDYFKEEMIPWSWEFLTGQSWLGIDPSRLYVTVFAGDEAVAKDDESVRLWQEQFSSSGVPSVEGERIVALGREDNWWGPVGETGPCGPDTEMFYDTGTAPCGPQCRAGCGCGKYLEIWNDVFMEFSMQADGSCQRLPRPNVDTGLGMARMLAVLNGVESVYDIDVLKPLIDCLANLSTRDHASIAVSFRIVADHVTSACPIIADGVAPANTERGYVLRRLIRRSLVHARKLGVRERALWRPLFDQLRRLYVDDYPGIDEHADHILQILTGEEEQFGRTIETGLKQFHGLVEADAVKRDRTIDGRAAFELFATYGFPLDGSGEYAGVFLSLIHI